MPELIRDSFRALAAGDARYVGDLHRSWYGYRHFARRFGQPQTVKAAMLCRGWNGGCVRPPLADLSAAQSAELEAVMDRFLNA